VTGTPISPLNVPVPGQLRLGWRIPALLVAVDRCHGRSATWAQLQLLSWVLTQRVGPEELLARLAEADQSDAAPVAIDPAVPLAVDRAIGAGLLERRGARVRLTDQGRATVSAVSAAGLLASERETLDGLGRQLSATDALKAFGEGL
jgi:hypothetical protein